jgi:hypothetical protein
MTLDSFADTVMLLIFDMDLNNKTVLDKNILEIFVLQQDQGNFLLKVTC